MKRGQGKRQASAFQKWVEAGYRYECMPMYLGLEQVLLSPDGNVRIYWSCTARDGIILQIKRLRPYHISFDYVDGGTVINDEREEMLLLLHELKRELDSLRARSKAAPGRDIQAELDKIVLNHAETVNHIERATE